LLFWLQGLLFLFGMFALLGWPMHGSWSVLIVSQVLMVIACQSVAAFVFLMTKDSMRVMSLMAAYSAPGFAFMGITFPATDMTLPARIWRELLPATHYVEIQLNHANYGSSPLSALAQMGTLLMFSLLLALALLKAKKIASGPEGKEVKRLEVGI
jgi:ABC-2 type transport system permease protein